MARGKFAGRVSEACNRFAEDRFEHAFRTLFSSVQLVRNACEPRMRHCVCADLEVRAKLGDLRLRQPARVRVLSLFLGDIRTSQRSRLP